MVQNRHSYRRNFKIVGIMDFSNIDEGHIDGEPELHYFYNREERIKNAPPIVQEYYNGGLRPVRGFKILFVKMSKNTRNLCEKYILKKLFYGCRME